RQPVPQFRYSHPRAFVRRPFEGEHDMATRPEIKVKKSEPEEVAQEAPNQRAKKEAGNYRLQVDRQTKAFYMTEEAAETAGMVIKKGHPVVQVSIYNSAEGVNKIIELPKCRRARAPPPIIPRPSRPAARRRLRLPSRRRHSHPWRARHRPWRQSQAQPP